MAHELTIRANGYTEMAFVGATPWHGLGQELEQNASIEQWRVAAGMDWSIEKSPVCYMPHGFYGDVSNFPKQNVLYRSDNYEPLSVVSDRYQVVQPAEVLEFFRDLVEQSGFRLHTAGTLFGGKRLWALAETGKFGEVTQGDGIGGFLLLSTSADKSLATTARFTSVRVVCNNTLSLSLQNSAHSVSFTHARKFDHELMKSKLGVAVASFDSFMEMAKHLERQRITTAQADNFIKRILFTADQLQNTDLNLEKNRPYNKILDLFKGEAKGADIVGDTKWALLNSVTEYFDHHHPSRTNDARLNNAWFGNGDTIKNRAVAVLTS
jgi:phage/plasmid-like protein (TIGR03299 family)